MMKKLAVAVVASLGLLAGEASAQGSSGPRPQGAPDVQPGPNNPNSGPRRPRGDQPAAKTPAPPPPVVQAPPPQPQQPPQTSPQTRQWGGNPRGGQPAPEDRRWEGRPRGQPPVVYDQRPLYRPAPPVYRPAPPVYRPAPPVYRQAPPIIVGPGPGYGPPPNWRHRRPYGWCRAKAERLHQFEYQMQLDGRISRDEMKIARSLRADLANSCGNGRWNPNRGWYNG